MTNSQDARPLSIQDLVRLVITHVRGMWRFRWLGLAVASALCLLAWLYILLMPPVFQASARIYVDTENAIRPLLRGIAISSDVTDEIVLVTNELLSRPNLAEVASATGLDARAKNDEDYEALMASLQRRITVRGSSQNIYSIVFEDTNREKAVAVVTALVDAFVNDSLGGNRSETDSAQEFLQEQIDEYEQRLVEAETRLADFKRENVAFMPDQSGDYFARLQAAQLELTATRDKVRVAEQRQQELERQIVGEEPVFGILPDLTPGSGGANSAQIRQLEEQLKQLQLQYTDKHPRISQIKENIAQLQAQAAEDANSNTRVINPLDVNPVYQNMRIQLSTTEVELATLRAQQTEQQRRVNQLRNQVDTIPQVEARLNALNRDYGVVRAKYEQLVQQLEVANIGEKVDDSIDDVQFNVIDPPFSETRPVGPNRPVFLIFAFIFLAGAGVAVMLGMSLLRPVFFGPMSITEATGIPVLGSVSRVDGKSARRRSRLANVAYALCVLLLIGVLGVAVGLNEDLSVGLRLLTGGQA